MLVPRLLREKAEIPRKGCFYMYESIRFPYPMKVKTSSLMLEGKYKYNIFLILSAQPERSRSWYIGPQKGRKSHPQVNTGLILIKSYLSANKGWVLIKSKLIDGVERTLIIFDDGCSLLKISQWKPPQTTLIVPRTTSGDTFSLNVSPLLHTSRNKICVRKTKKNLNIVKSIT